MNTIVKATLNMSTLSPDGKVTKGENIVLKMQASSYFDPASLPLPYATVSTALANLHTAIIASGSGSPGSISNVHKKERVLMSMFNLLRAYVEMVANDTADPKTVIESAGMSARAANGHAAVSELTLSAMGEGSIEVSVPRLPGEAAFVYQYSSDAGATWLHFESSKLATVQLKNQVPAAILHFRYAAIGKTMGAFSQPKSVIVL